MTEAEGGWGLGPVTPQEADAARKWLSKRGAPVSSPRPFLAVRLGMRHRQRVWFRYYLVFVLLAVAGITGYWMLQKLPNVRGKDMPEGIPIYFICCAHQLAVWRTWLRVDRKLAARGALVDANPLRQPWWKVLGGWYLAALAVTFLGGAALGTTMFLTTPAKTYAWSWLGVLAIGALSTAVVLTSTLRAPVIADDEATRAVDELVRAENADVAFPAMFAVPVFLDLVWGNRQPHSFTWLLVGYAVLSAGLQVIAAVRHERRVLPPGDYGLPAAEPTDSVGAR